LPLISKLIYITNKVEFFRFVHDTETTHFDLAVLTDTVGVYKLPTTRIKAA